jgi:hypothetical protein
MRNDYITDIIDILDNLHSDRIQFADLGTNVSVSYVDQIPLLLHRLRVGRGWS